MLKNLIVIFLLGAGMLACNNDHNHAEGTEHHDHDGHDHDKASDANAKQFGAEITADGAEAFETFVGKMADIDSLDAKVLGTVESVCQTKGCWMNIATENGEEMFVQFEDYGFFMPKDIAGKKVIMDGYAYREVTSVEELRHYAEDEGLSAEEIEKITEPEENLKFMASGVILVD